LRSEGVLTRERAEGGRGRCACIKAPSPSCTSAPSSSSGTRILRTVSCRRRGWSTCTPWIATGCVSRGVRAEPHQGRATRGARGGRVARHTWHRRSGVLVVAVVVQHGRVAHSRQRAARSDDVEGDEQTKALPRHESAREPRADVFFCGIAWYRVLVQGFWRVLSLF